MIVIDSIDVIVPFETLSDEEKTDIKTYFETHKECHILDMGNGCFCTYRQVCRGLNSTNICVEYNPDMFLLSYDSVVDYGYAIAIGEHGEYMAVLREEGTTYIHAYEYQGGVDCWFINEYDCMFLNGCNELSVELIRAIMPLWTGNRLVLVGKEWEPLIPMLPDVPDKECFYEPELYQNRAAALTDGKKPLYITTGFPHEETMERYENGLMTYDEIMSFLFLFSDYKELGEENPDKNFFVMDAHYSNLGLFALFGKAECCARYAKSRGFVPVIRILKSSRSMYSDFSGDDIWGKFYNQPERYSMEEVMTSKHVCFAPGFYNGSIQNTLMNRMSGDIKLTWPNGIYNERVTSYLAEKESRFLLYPEKTLGVLARGTDYVNTHLPNHAIHASKEMICEKIDELLAVWEDLEYIYLASEDADYCEYFKERYGEKIYFTDQERFITKEGEMLSALHRANSERSDGFRMGVEYILSVYLLSKCNSLLASGNCAGVWETIKENNDSYKHKFVFDLGTNS